MNHRIPVKTSIEFYDFEILKNDHFSDHRPPPKFANQKFFPGPLWSETTTVGNSGRHVEVRLTSCGRLQPWLIFQIFKFK